MNGCPTEKLRSVFIVVVSSPGGLFFVFLFNFVYLFRFFSPKVLGYKNTAQKITVFKTPCDFKLELLMTASVTDGSRTVLRAAAGSKTIRYD